jgi:phospholipid/cholesterol/gamma-HCH transport system substrate-binding protein
VLAGILVTTLWLARIQFQTEYKYYETNIQGSVTGLAAGAVVRLNGIEVGRVTRIEQNPKDPQLVRLILQVQDTIEIRADAIASLETLGLTGVDYVEISGGTLASPPLVAAPGEPYPTIASRPSSLQQVFDNAPELVSRLMVISDRVAAVLDDKNREAISDTLANIRDTTAVFKDRSQEIGRLIDDSDRTMRNLEAASTTLRDVLAKLDRTSDKVDGVVTDADVAVRQATKLAADIDAVVEATRPGLRSLTTDGVNQLNQLLIDARHLVASLDRVSEKLERDPGRFLFGEPRSGYAPR